MRVAGMICFILYSAIAISATQAFGMDVDKNVLVSLASERGLQLLPAGAGGVVRSSARGAGRGG